jgi:hypothetical protein
MGNELPEEAAADARKTSDRVGGGIVFVSGLGFLAIGLFAWPSAPSDAISALAPGLLPRRPPRSAPRQGRPLFQLSQPPV